MSLSRFEHETDNTFFFKVHFPVDIWQCLKANIFFLWEFTELDTDGKLKFYDFCQSMISLLFKQLYVIRLYRQASKPFERRPVEKCTLALFRPVSQASRGVWLLSLNPNYCFFYSLSIKPVIINISLGVTSSSLMKISTMAGILEQEMNKRLCFDILFFNLKDCLLLKNQ